jgi:hypothetical protein
VTDLGVGNDTAEFHLVVRRPSDRSPLAPYRFSLSVAFALLVGANELWAALPAGPGLDIAVARVLVAALFAWIVLGVVNRAVRPARVAPTDTDPHRTSSDSDRPDV